MSATSRTDARRAHAAHALAFAILAGVTAPAAADTKASYALSPYLKAKASEGDQTVDVGLQRAPTSGFGLTTRLTATVGKPDEALPAGELSNERRGVGARLQLLWEWPTSVPHVPPVPSAKLDRGLSRFGAGVDGRWSVAKHEWNPGGGEQRSRFDHTFKLEARGWWFGSTKPRVSGGKPGAAQAGKPPPGALSPVDYDVTLFQPQVRASFTRAWREADDSWIVQPPPATGPQLAEKLKITPPTLTPTLSVLVAVAFEPPGPGRFAFAPAVRFTSRGTGAREWDPTGKVSRLRFELWSYLFAFADETVRIGAAPFMDVRLAGGDKRDELVAGGVVELRTGTSRLEY